MLERLDQAYATCAWQGPEAGPAPGLERVQAGSMDGGDPVEYGSTPGHVRTVTNSHSDHQHCSWEEARGSGSSSKSSSSKSLHPFVTSPRRSPTGGLGTAHCGRPATAVTVSNASTSNGASFHGGVAGAPGASCCSPSGRCGSQQGHSGGHQPPHPDTLYYRRQLLTLSVEGRRVDVITISDCWGATGGVEPPVPGVFEHDPGPPAAEFAGKKVRAGMGQGMRGHPTGRGRAVTPAALWGKVSGIRSCSAGRGCGFGQGGDLLCGQVSRCSFTHSNCRPL